MSWELRYSAKAVKQLRKFDPGVHTIILSWMDKNIQGCENPRIHGKALSGNLAGAWRYRVGDYRILCELHDESLVVLAIEIAHRREVYR